MTDRQILELVHNIVGGEFAEDLGMSALPDNEPSPERTLRLMRQASRCIGLVYSIVHGHLPRTCHHVHGPWRDLAQKLYDQMQESDGSVEWDPPTDTV